MRRLGLGMLLSGMIIGVGIAKATGIFYIDLTFLIFGIIMALATMSLMPDGE